MDKVPMKMLKERLKTILLYFITSSKFTTFSFCLAEYCSVGVSKIPFHPYQVSTDFPITDLDSVILKIKVALFLVPFIFQLDNKAGSYKTHANSNSGLT